MKQGRTLFLPVLCLCFFLLVGLAGCGSVTQAASTQTKQTLAPAPTTPAGYIPVYVTLSDFKISSSLTEFKKTVHYFFIITNKGQALHEFMIVPPMMGGHITTQYMQSMSFAVIENISPGETKTLEMTFPKNAYPDLEFACHYADHYAKGMHLEVHLIS
ncbi:MAG TPA: hypothetical protein DHW02_23435 [Ktedonobacter sp.]|nr:hypothetical protein [Ktedonobacter sp.]